MCKRINHVRRAIALSVPLGWTETLNSEGKTDSYSDSINVEKFTLRASQTRSVKSEQRDLSGELLRCPSP